MLDRITQWVLTLFAVAMLPAGLVIAGVMKDARMAQVTPDRTCEAVQALLFSANYEEPEMALGTDVIRAPPRTVALQAFDDLPQAMDSLLAGWPQHQRGWLWRSAVRAEQADLMSCAIPLNTRIIISDNKFYPPSAASYFNSPNHQLDPFAVWNDSVPTCENTQVFTVGRVVSEPGGRSALIEYDDCTPDDEMSRFHRRRMGKVGRATFSNAGWAIQPVTFTD